jgi:hypothetical protein
MIPASEPSGIFQGFNIPLCTNLLLNKTCIPKPVTGLIPKIKEKDHNPALVKAIIKELQLVKYNLTFDEWWKKYGEAIDKHSSC